MMQGQSVSDAYAPLPGGAVAMYNSSGSFQYNHVDWLGSARLLSTPSPTVSPAMAYAPFGEGYESGSLDDFTFRRYAPVQGRWLSPDPAGLGAVDPSNPQSWNRYAYVLNNPLANVDPLGLAPPFPGLCKVDGSLAPCTIVDGALQNGTAAICPPGGGCTFNQYGVLVQYQHQCFTGDGCRWTWVPISSEMGPVGAANTDSPAWAFTETLFSWQPQKDAWNKGYYKCLAKTAAGGATAPVVTHAAGVAATNAVENGASTIAGAYYHFTDGRFTAWGKYSQVLVPNLAPKIAAVAEALDVAGWAYFDYELGKAIGECSGVLQ